MKILITGCNGQLGSVLQPVLTEYTLECHDRPTLDLLDPTAVGAKFAAFKPNVVINAAAYTAVDKAEEEVEIADAINHTAVATLACECAKHNARLIHVSTDFVFDGNQSTPYKPDDNCNPISVYGDTKLKGEQAIRKALPNSSVIIRTAWLYSTFGNNFVKTMLRLMRDRSQLKVVADQVGTPTNAVTLAAVIKQFITQPDIAGVFHWTDAGVASWYDFAIAIYEEATALGILTSKVEVLPIPTSEYPTPAKRPAFSVLDKEQTYSHINMPKQHWRVLLRTTLIELSRQEANLG